jgi:hypothetical protein
MCLFRRNLQIQVVSAEDTYPTFPLNAEILFGFSRSGLPNAAKK